MLLLLSELMFLVFIFSRENEVINWKYRESFCALTLLGSGLDLSTLTAFCFPC